MYMLTALAFACALALAFAHVWLSRHRAGGHRVVGVAAALWAVYGLWELSVAYYSPEANIRVDLLLIYPVLAVMSLWAVVKGLKLALSRR